MRDDEAANGGRARIRTPATLSLFEAHLVVAEPDASVAFYRDVLGLELAYRTPDAAFLWIGARGRGMLGLWAAGRAPQTVTNHIAFGATLEDVLAAPEALRLAGVTPLDFDGHPTAAPVVIGWMPAACVYFRDPDGHLLEYVAMLPDAPHADHGVLSWDAWQRRQSGAGPASYTIRRARRQDLAQVPLIELAAARLLVNHAPESVLNETTSLEELQRAIREERLWVALADDLAVGFAHVRMIEAASAHLDEVDVLPAYGRRGLGTRLVLHVCRWAEANGLRAVTLTTFRDVPWNMPFYERLGFRVVPAADLSPALRAVIQDETRRGLDPSRRVVMTRGTCCDTSFVRPYIRSNGAGAGVAPTAGELDHDGTGLGPRLRGGTAACPQLLPLSDGPHG